MSEQRGTTGAGKAAIMARIRRSLHAPADDTGRRAAVEDRIARHEAGLIPKRGDGDLAARTALFRKMMEYASATVTEVDSADQVPAAVADYLKSNNLPAQIRHGDDPAVAGLDWSNQPMLEVGTGRAVATDPTSISAAFCAVSESGTVFLNSGADNPTTLNFLPENHIVVVRAADIEGNFEACFTRMRAKFGAGQMPRVLNMISGPSRTGDIEQTILLGAHGPKRMHIIIVR
jgi:L-lactate dehydrogenase complex protein LldG